MKSGNQIQESYSSFSASIKNTISPALKAQMQNKSKISSFCYWSPLMTLPNSGDVFHWVIGFSEDSLIFIKCTSAKYPTLFPNYIPVPSTLQVKVPVINAESQSGSIEEEYPFFFIILIILLSLIILLIFIIYYFIIQ